MGEGTHVPALEHTLYVFYLGDQQRQRLMDMAAGHGNYRILIEKNMKSNVLVEDRVCS